MVGEASFPGRNRAGLHRYAQRVTVIHKVTPRTMRSRPRAHCTVIVLRNKCLYPHQQVLRRHFHLPPKAPCFFTALPCYLRNEEHLDSEIFPASGGQHTPPDKHYSQRPPICRYSGTCRKSRISKTTYGCRIPSRRHGEVSNQTRTIGTRGAIG